MSRTRWLALAAPLLLAACSRPLAPEQQRYAGLWKNAEMSLLITPGGRVDYERHRGGGNVSVSGPVQSLDDNGLVVGVSFLRTRFSIDRAPAQANGIWTMVVDGQELTRADKNGRLPQATVVPPLEALRALVDADLRRLGDGFVRGELSEFRDHTSKVFQSQHTVEELNAAFRSGLDRKLDLGHLMAAPLELTSEPRVTEDGVLEVKGRYPPVDGAALRFELEYVYAAPEWKLAGVSYKVRADEGT